MSNASNPDKEMSFFEHLDELRAHLIRALLGIVVGAIFVFILSDFIFTQIIFAPVRGDFISYEGLCILADWLGAEVLCFRPKNIALQTFDMGEAFLIHLQVCFIGGFILAFPYVFWEFWRFVSPGLHEHERRGTRRIVVICSFLFLLGISFGYFILAPFSINFLVNYELPLVNVQTNFLKVSSYLGYLVMFTLPIGLAFELPIVVFYLSKLGLVTAEGMRAYRRHALVGILVVAAVITPPDMISQVIVGLPLYVLYELSIYVAKKQGAED